MSDELINRALKKYIHDTLSPTPDDRTYVSDKYDTIQKILGDSCFMAGSFARFTAVRPLHDLDVIWVTDDQSVIDNPKGSLERLANVLREGYRKLGLAAPMITVQSHSVTLHFDDAEDENGFSVDVVPATHSLDPDHKNEYGDRILIVPAIIKMSHAKRNTFYASQRKDGDVEWVYTDPKGYIKAASELNRQTRDDYRRAAKFTKAWRNGAKRLYEDDWKLKSFHVEQIVALEHANELEMDALSAVRTTFSAMTNYITAAPCIPDRAYAALEEEKYIDEDVSDPYKVSKEQLGIILDQVEEANRLIAKLPACTNEEEVIMILDQITNPDEQQKTGPRPTQSVYASPARPYARS